MKKRSNELKKELAMLCANAGALDQRMIREQVLSNQNAFYSYIPFILQGFYNDGRFLPR